MSKTKMTYGDFKALAEKDATLKRKIQKFNNLFTADLTSDIAQQAFIHNLDNLLKHQKTFNDYNASLNENSPLKINSELDYLSFTTFRGTTLIENIIIYNAYLVIEHLRAKGLMEVSVDSFTTALDNKTFPEDKLKDLLADLHKNSNYKPEDFIEMLSTDMGFINGTSVRIARAFGIGSRAIADAGARTIRLAKLMNDGEFSKIFNDEERNRFIRIGLERFSFKNGDLATVFDKFDNSAFINYRNSKDCNIFHVVIGSNKINEILDYVIQKVGHEKTKELLNYNNNDNVTPIDLIKNKETRKFLEDKGLIEKSLVARKEETKPAEASANEKNTTERKSKISEYTIKGALLGMAAGAALAVVLVIVLILFVLAPLHLGWVATPIAVGFFIGSIVIGSLIGRRVGRNADAKLLAEESHNQQLGQEAGKTKVTELANSQNAGQSSGKAVPALYPNLDPNAPPPSFDAPHVGPPPSYEQSIGQSSVPTPPNDPPPVYTDYNGPSNNVVNPGVQGQTTNNGRNS